MSDRQSARQSDEHAPPVRACLITNPRSGRGGIDLSEVLPVLRGQSWEVIVRQKLHGGHATELAQEAAHDGYSVVVGCGGDGTLSEIVDGLAGTEVAVGALPGGTANVWAHELGISPRLRVAALQLVGAQRRRVDLGHVAINGRHRHHFLLMAGLGTDGAVMSRVSKPLKNRLGKLAVGLAAVQALPDLGSVPVRIELDGVHWQGRVSQIVVANTRRYGGFTVIAPDALIDDGLLDICLFTADGPISGARQLFSLTFLRHPDDTSSETYRAARVIIYAPLPLPLQLDGGVMRLKKERPGPEGMVYSFAVSALALSVLVPRTYNGALFAQPSPHLAALLPNGHHGHADDRRNGSDGHAARRTKDEKDARRVLTVIATGADSFTALHAATEHVLTVQIGAETTVQDHAGETLPVPEALASLSEGQRVRVRGETDAETGTIMARRVRVLTEGDGSRQEDEHGE